MKSNKKFPPALGAIVGQALKDKSACCVCLTIEEAEKLMKHLDLCEYLLTNNDVSYDCDAWASLLEERIEQVEDFQKQEEIIRLKCEINQLLTEQALDDWLKKTGF